MTATDIDNLPAKDLDQFPDLASAAVARTRRDTAVGADLDQHQVPLDEVAVRKIEHLDDGDDLLELLADLVKNTSVTVDDKRYPGKLGVLGLTHSQAVDVEGA